MKILVTGATGFLGTAFTRNARAHGHEVAGMMLPTEKPPADLQPSPSLAWLRGTLAEPPWGEIESWGPEVCVHFAWLATPGIYLESPENKNYFDWSLAFARRLRSSGLRHFLGIGTCIEYQITNQPLSESNTPVAPSTTYARYKNELRLALEQDARDGQQAFAWARVFYPYGVGEHPARLCSSIIQKLSRGEKITLKTPQSTKDYIYISDLAEALVLLVEKQFRGVINLGTGIPISVREIAGTLAAMLQRPELIGEVEPPEVDPLGFVVADNSRLRGLGWHPRHDLRGGLQKLLEAARVGDYRS